MYVLKMRKRAKLCCPMETLLTSFIFNNCETLNTGALPDRLQLSCHNHSCITRARKPNFSAIKTCPHIKAYLGTRLSLLKCWSKKRALYLGDCFKSRCLWTGHTSRDLAVYLRDILHAVYLQDILHAYNTLPRMSRHRRRRRNFLLAFLLSTYEVDTTTDEETSSSDSSIYGYNS